MITTRAMLACGAFVVATGGGLLVAAAATAGPPVPVIGAHQHWALTATGEYVKVGPNSCDNGQSIQFDNFHINGHIGVPGNAKLGIITGLQCGDDANIPGPE